MQKNYLVEIILTLAVRANTAPSRGLNLGRVELQLGNLVYLT
jgi:hypothetical protein